MPLPRCFPHFCDTSVDPVLSIFAPQREHHSSVLPCSCVTNFCALSLLSEYSQDVRRQSVELQYVERCLFWLSCKQIYSYARLHVRPSDGKTRVKPLTIFGVSVVRRCHRSSNSCCNCNECHASLTAIRRLMRYLEISSPRGHSVRPTDRLQR